MIRNRPIPARPPRTPAEAIRILEALLTDGFRMMQDLGAFRGYRPPPPPPRAIGCHPRRSSARRTTTPTARGGRLPGKPRCR